MRDIIARPGAYAHFGEAEVAILSESWNMTVDYRAQVGMTVDEEGFHAEMASQKARSKEAAAARRCFFFFFFFCVPVS